MTIICGHTGIPVGSETCKLCVIHSCEGYKKSIKKNKDKNIGFKKFLKKKDKNTLLSKIMLHNCPNCGAPIDSYRSKCAYCGTMYSDLDM